MWFNQQLLLSQILPEVESNTQGTNSFSVLARGQNGGETAGEKGH